jgi:hypothetical protein
MRTSLRAVVALVIAVGAILTAVTASASTSISPDTPVASEPDPGPEPSSGPKVVEPRPGMMGVIPSAYDSATIGQDDVTLTITFWGGVEPCSVLDHVDITEGPRAVTVTLYVGSDPNAGDVACPELAMLKQVSMTLNHPLDGRDVVDGAVA